MIVSLGKRIALPGTNLNWQSEVVTLGRANAVSCEVVVVSTPGTSMAASLWGSNEPSRGFFLLAQSTELTTTGQTAKVEAGPVGVKYVQLRFGAVEIFADSVVLAATLQTYRR